MHVITEINAVCLSDELMKDQGWIHAIETENGVTRKEISVGCIQCEVKEGTIKCSLTYVAEVWETCCVPSGRQFPNAWVLVQSSDPLIANLT